MIHRLVNFLIALWWGSLTALGALYVPTIFATLTPKAVAGQATAALFHVQFYVSLGCMGLLLAWQLFMLRSNVRRRGAWQNYFILGVAIICVFLVEWVVAPHIALRQDMAFWHGLGSGLFLIQWVVATRMLWASADNVMSRD
jgi:hypothetical protein